MTWTVLLPGVAVAILNAVTLNVAIPLVVVLVNGANAQLAVVEIVIEVLFATKFPYWSRAVT